MYRCEDCGKGFAQKHSLDCHLATKHGKMMPKRREARRADTPPPLKDESHTFTKLPPTELRPPFASADSSANTNIHPFMPSFNPYPKHMYKPPANIDLERIPYHPTGDPIERIQQRDMLMPSSSSMYSNVNLDTLEGQSQGKASAFLDLSTSQDSQSQGRSSKFISLQSQGQNQGHSSSDISSPQGQGLIDLSISNSRGQGNISQSLNVNINFSSSQNQNDGNVSISHGRNSFYSSKSQYDRSAFQVGSQDHNEFSSAQRLGIQDRGSDEFSSPQGRGDLSTSQDDVKSQAMFPDRPEVKHEGSDDLQRLNYIWP